MEIAELRLWLQLIVDAELLFEERKISPLLPNLSFNVASFRNLEASILDTGKRRAYMPSSLKGKLTRLKGEKLKYYNNAKDCKFRTEKEIYH